MIINMSGGRVGVQYQTFTISQTVTMPDYLEIPNVSVPGGVIKGFVLLKDNNTNYLQNNEILIAYSNEEQFKAGGIIYEVYQSSDTGLHRVELSSSTGVILYDEETHVLKISSPDAFYPGAFWYTGQYCLFVW